MCVNEILLVALIVFAGDESHDVVYVCVNKILLVGLFVFAGDESHDVVQVWMIFEFLNICL